MGTVQKNFLYNVAYQILILLLPLITAPYISRTLGATAAGIYSYTNSVAYYFLMAAMLGISNHGNRSVAAVRNNPEKLKRVFSSIYMLQICTFSIAIAAYIIYCMFVVNDNKIIAALQLLYVASGLLDISWLFFGLEKFKLTVGRNILIKSATVLCMFVFVHDPGDLWKYTLIMSAGTFLSQAYLWMYVKKETEFIKVPFAEVADNFKPVCVLFIPVLSYSIYKVMDKIMLGQMSTYAQVGYYQNAEKIISIPMGIITAFGTVMLPRMSNIIAEGDREKSKSYIRLSTKFVTLLCSPIAFGLMGISAVLAPVYLGEEFSACTPLISILSLTVFFVAWANVIRTQYLIPCHYDRVYILSTIVGALVNLIINMALIPVWEGVGAALGTVAAEFSVMIIQMIYVRKRLHIHRYILRYLPVIVAGFFMMIVVRLTGNVLGINILSLILQIFTGAVIFISLTAVYFYVSGDELGIMLKKSIAEKSSAILKPDKNKPEQL